MKRRKFLKITGVLQKCSRRKNPERLKLYCENKILRALAVYADATEVMSR
jgi:hypothetical protein